MDIVKESFRKTRSKAKESRVILAVIVFCSLLGDSMLLTLVGKDSITRNISIFNANFCGCSNALKSSI